MARKIAAGKPAAAAQSRECRDSGINARSCAIRRDSRWAMTAHRHLAIMHVR